MRRDVFDMAMVALEAAHESYVRSMRSHAANLMTFGLTPGDVEDSLADIDNLESSLADLRQQLHEAAAL